MSTAAVANRPLGPGLLKISILSLKPEEFTWRKPTAGQVLKICQTNWEAAPAGEVAPRRPESPQPVIASNMAFKWLSTANSNLCGFPDLGLKAVSIIDLQSESKYGTKTASFKVTSLTPMAFLRGSKARV